MKKPLPVILTGNAGGRHPTRREEIPRMLHSLSPSADDSYFGNKKILVTYVLSVLVFWIHISTFYNYGPYPPALDVFIIFIQSVTSRVAVPLFFILSGALFYRNYTPGSYGQKLKSRVRTLLIPYFCWNILMMLFLAAATILFSRFFIGRHPFDFSLRGILEGLFHWRYNSPFWFIFALMVFAVCAPVIYPILRNRYTGLAAVAILWLLSEFELGLPEPMFHDRTCIVYYLIGGLLGIHGWDRFRAPSKSSLRLPAAVCLLLCWAFFFGICYDLYQPGPGIILGFRLLNAFALWICADTVCEHVRARVFMEHSFWVYAMHMNVGAVVTKLIYLIGPKHWAMAVPNFLLTTALTLAIIEATCALLRKYAPPVYRLLCGSR